MKLRVVLFFMPFFLSAIVAKSDSLPAEELQRIKTNYINYLIPSGSETDGLIRLLSKIEQEEEISDQMVMELHQRYPFDLVKIESYINALNTDGSWNDINYDDTKRSGWEPKIHAERVLELTKLYHSSQTQYYHSEPIASIVHRALNYWFVTKPVCLNWWYNEIGIPKTFGMAFVLFEDQLSDEEKKEAVAVMQNSTIKMTGQNKVWLAGNVLIRGLLQNDFDLVRMAHNTIVSEIVTDRKEGIKSDWSFHQHGAQQQFGNYGLSYISGMSFFSGLFAGTSLAINEKQLNILASLINEGYRWIIWRGYMDINALDRQLFHNASIHKAFGLAFAAVELAKTRYPSCMQAAENILSDNFPPLLPGGRPFTGHKHFWDSDQTLHRTSQWAASVKMASNRVIGTELVNEDNLKGYYMADGATYTYVRGDEYLNVFPLWDWRKIPGITSFESNLPVPRLQNSEARNKSDFAGGVTNGRMGLTAMMLNRNGLKARKSWIFTDDWIFCLGSGIKADSGLVVTTSIDQRLKFGDLFYLDNGKWTTVKGKKTNTTGKQRFFHDNTGYIILQPANTVATSEKRTGQWRDFMQTYRPADVEGEVISLYLNHGINPQGDTYQYLILPAATKEKTEQFDVSSLHVIQNDKIAQAMASEKDNTYWVVAYEPVRIRLSENMDFDVETPGLYMICGKGNDLQVHYTDPTRTLYEVFARINGKRAGYTFSEEMKGKSVVMIS
ncbi:Chondroitinase-AC [termite gut metagenome]|uniref:Chondroitinase-AC n=1 Tax=termite gut metagenome TaxID=433724 RepID=A0A5J4SU39_9ZZZZ